MLKKIINAIPAILVIAFICWAIISWFEVVTNNTDPNFIASEWNMFAKFLELAK